MGAFHAYDIRGVFGIDLDAAFAYKAGYFIPALLGADKVLVGRDMRVSSPELHEALVKGITDAGADVWDLGLSTTPMVYFGTARYGFEASVQITASHNPGCYNGLKVSRRDALPVGLDSGLGTLKQWMEEERPAPVAAKRGKVVPFDIREEYLAFQKSYMRDWSDLNFAVDFSNGMASIFADDIFGSRPIRLFDTLDGTFPNHEANPLLPENRIALSKAVIEKGCDLGVVFDGDADRVMFVDDRGEFISPDLVIALLGDWFFKDRSAEGCTVLQDIRSSKSVGEYLCPKGASIATRRVGRAYAAPRLREIDGLFGGELAGHYYFKDFFYSDSGLLASILVLNIAAALKREGIRLSDKIASISHYCNSGEINFKLERKAEAMEALREHFTSLQKPTAFMDFDGYRVEFPDWWFNIRPSNTEPYLRFICEASTKQMLEAKIAEATRIIESFF